MNSIFVAAVVGPTASGKTALAVSLAEKLGGEIISADSMQIYKGMDIATAMPTHTERALAKHHLIDFLEPSEPFSVARYTALAGECISKIEAVGKLPIICGGTGLYINTLLENIELLPDASCDEVRKKLMKEIEISGADKLFERLKVIDPKTASRLHENDIKRIVRALEVYEITGQTMSEQEEKSRLVPSRYKVCYIGLTAENRQFLYDRIDRRVDLMLEQGLIEEARCFYSRSDCATAAQAIGYKELKPYLDGECTLEQATDRLKMSSRRYAKRQLTWFRRNERINWLYIDHMSLSELSDAAERIITEGMREENEE